MKSKVNSTTKELISALLQFLARHSNSTFADERLILAITERLYELEDEVERLNDVIYDHTATGKEDKYG